MMLVTLLAIGLAVVLALSSLRNCKRVSAEEKVMKGYFLLGLSGIMAKVAMADGVVTCSESEIAQRFFSRMDLTDAERATCIGNFIVSRGDNLTARDHARRFIAYANPAACRFLYDMLWRIARADGELAVAEDALLREIATYLGLNERDYEAFKRGEKPSYRKADLQAAGVPQTFINLAR